MAYTQPKRNNRATGNGRCRGRGIHRLLFIAVGALIFALFAGTAWADLVLYDPDIDVSVSVYKPLVNGDDAAPDIAPGVYFGVYLSRKSRFFTDYFNADRIYTIFEGGIAINPIRDEDANYVTVPLHADIAYKIGQGKFSFLPFISLGLNFTFNGYLSNPEYNENFNDGSHAAFSVGTGFELRWTILTYSALRLKFDYGILFDDRVESGYMYYTRLRLPLPFIP
jgi:hypothetical protein